MRSSYRIPNIQTTKIQSPTRKNKIILQCKQFHKAPFMAAPQHTPQVI